MPKGLSRLGDPVQLAATIIGLATGRITEGHVAADRAPKRRAGGLEGGPSRVKALTGRAGAPSSLTRAHRHAGKRAATTSE